MYAYPRNRTRCIFPAVLLASLISMAPLGCHSFACLSYIFAVRRFLYAPYYEHNNRHVLMVNNYSTLLIFCYINVSHFYYRAIRGLDFIASVISGSFAAILIYRAIAKNTALLCLVYFLQKLSSGSQATGKWYYY